MDLTECCLSVPQSHDCGEIFESRKVKTSFNPEFSVNYCPNCRMYVYNWGAEDKTGIESKDKQEVIKYIESSQKIIRQTHLRNMAKVEGFRERFERGLVPL